MREHKRKTPVLFCALLAATLAMAPALAATAWRTVAASGPVEARPPVDEQADWHKVVRGDTLAPRTELRTGRRGRATLTQEAGVLIVDPETRLELPLSMASDDESSVVQTSGSVIYRVDGSKVRNFEVVTPYLVAGVKGTIFMVTVEDDRASVSVREGVVEVLDPETGGFTEVHAGETLFVSDESQERELVPLRTDDSASRKERKTVRREQRQMDRRIAVATREEGLRIDDIRQDEKEPAGDDDRHFGPAGIGPLDDGISTTARFRDDLDLPIDNKELADNRGDGWDGRLTEEEERDDRLDPSGWDLDDDLTDDDSSDDDGQGDHHWDDDDFERETDDDDDDRRNFAGDRFGRGPTP